MALCQLRTNVLSVCSLALCMVKNNLAHTHAFRCNFYVLVFLDVFKCFFKAELCGRNDVGFFVCTACTHVGELLGLGHVDHEVYFVYMFTNDLPCIHLVLRVDEESPAVLQFVECVGKHGASLHCNE